VEPPAANRWQAALCVADDFMRHSLGQRTVWVCLCGLATGNKPSDKRLFLGSIRDDQLALLLPWMVCVCIGHGSETVAESTIEKPSLQPHSSGFRLKLMRAQSPSPMHQLGGLGGQTLIINSSVPE
jgi:hypothetical protein